MIYKTLKLHVISISQKFWINYILSKYKFCKIIENMRNAYMNYL